MKLNIETEDGAVEVETDVELTPAQVGKLTEALEMVLNKRCDLCGSVLKLTSVRVVESKGLRRTRRVPVGMMLEWKCGCGGHYLAAFPHSALDGQDTVEAVLEDAPGR